DEAQAGARRSRQARVRMAVLPGERWEEDSPISGCVEGEISALTRGGGSYGSALTSTSISRASSLKPPAPSPAPPPPPLTLPPAAAARAARGPVLPRAHPRPAGLARGLERLDGPRLDLRRLEPRAQPVARGRQRRPADQHPVHRPVERVGHHGPAPLHAHAVDAAVDEGLEAVQLRRAAPAGPLPLL